MEQTPQQPKRIKALSRTYDLQQLNVRHHEKHSVVEVFSKKNNRWDAIAEIKGADHRTFAEFIVFKIQTQSQTSTHLEEAINALQLCLESNELSWEAEQEAEAILKKTRGTNASA